MGPGSLLGQGVMERTERRVVGPLLGRGCSGLGERVGPLSGQGKVELERRAVRMVREWRARRKVLHRRRKVVHQERRGKAVKRQGQQAKIPSHGPGGVPGVLVTGRTDGGRHGRGAAPGGRADGREAGTGRGEARPGGQGNTERTEPSSSAPSVVSCASTLRAGYTVKIIYWSYFYGENKRKAKQLTTIIEELL